MPVISVHRGMRVRTYVTNVIRRGSFPSKTLRVSIFDDFGGTYDEPQYVGVYVRSTRGWEFYP